MAHLPSSWGLRTKKRKDGKLDVIGKDDTGADYKVRTCDSGSVTEADVQAIRECDREQYPSRDKGAREYVKNLVDAGKAFKRNQENSFEDEIEELALPIIHDQNQGSTVGSTALYRANFDKVFGEK